MNMIDVVTDVIRKYGDIKDIIIDGHKSNVWYFHLLCRHFIRPRFVSPEFHNIYVKIDGSIIHVKINDNAGLFVVDLCDPNSLDRLHRYFDRVCVKMR